MNYPYAFLQFLFCALSDLVLDFLGLFVVAIAIPFRKSGLSIQDGRYITILPDWAWLWSNDFDGLLGDKDGQWASESPFSFPPTSFLSMYWWAALRNPANNMRMLSIYQAPIIGSTIIFRGNPIVADKPGQGGCQFVKLTNPTCWPRYGFYWIHEWSSTHAFIIRLGFKISPDLWNTDSLPKGETTRINFYKSIV